MPRLNYTVLDNIGHGVKTSQAANDHQAVYAKQIIKVAGVSRYSKKVTRSGSTVGTTTFPGVSPLPR